MSNGAAWLYMKYVTGQFGNLNTTEMSNLQTAITTLMSGSTSGWSTTNTYLQYLLANSGLSQSQAIAAYQVGDQSVTAGYAVFVVQLNTSASFTTSGNRQDFLYIARYSPDVPEPATILLWSLGSVGAFGFGWMKKRRKMMTAMA